MRVTVGVSGTGGGFEKFCNGETDISAASRPIKQQEIDACAEAGIEYIPLRVGLDGLAIVAHPDADFLECITMEELSILWGPDSEDNVTSWNQVRAGWPDQEIKLFGPDTDSGHLRLLHRGSERRGRRLPRRLHQLHRRQRAGHRHLRLAGGSGYFGYAYYAENKERLRVAAVDGGSGCVIPSDATVSDGSYALARPLFIYVSTKSLVEKPQVREFVRYYLSDDAIALVPEVGYTAIPGHRADRVPRQPRRGRRWRRRLAEREESRASN